MSPTPAAFGIVDSFGMLLTVVVVAACASDSIGGILGFAGWCRKVG